MRQDPDQITIRLPLTLLTGLVALVAVGCQVDESEPKNEYESADDIPTPSDDVGSDDGDDGEDDDDGSGDNDDGNGSGDGSGSGSGDDLDDTGMVDTGTDETGPVTYSYNDDDSLIYVQIWKDEDAWGSDLAHNHVIRGDLWDGEVELDTDDLSDCRFDFTVPVSELAVDEDSMREYVGYSDTISTSDRKEIREHMLDSNQLDGDNFASIRFEADDCSGSGGDSGSISVSGKWTIRGVTHSETETLSYQVHDDKLYLQGTYDLSHGDFGMDPYEAFGGLVANEEEFRITIDVVGHPN